MCYGKVRNSKRRKPHRKNAPRTDCERDTCDNDEHETMYRDLEQEVKETDPKKIKKTMAKETTEAEARALTQKAAVAETAAWAASAALSAAMEEDFISMSSAAAAEVTEASEAKETKGQHLEILALIQERKTIAKHEKERIREISKKIKNCIRENEEKTRKNPKDHGRGQRNKEHFQYQICEEANPHLQSQKQRRRNYQSEARNFKCLCEIRTKICTKVKMVTLEKERTRALMKMEKILTNRTPFQNLQKMRSKMPLAAEKKESKRQQWSKS